MRSNVNVVGPNGGKQERCNIAKINIPDVLSVRETSSDPRGLLVAHQIGNSTILLGLWTINMHASFMHERSSFPRGPEYRDYCRRLNSLYGSFPAV